MNNNTKIKYYLAFAKVYGKCYSYTFKILENFSVIINQLNTMRV